MTKILSIRGKKVIIDHDLAELYDVPTKRLNEQVKRNMKRFPEHFMFLLTKSEKDHVVANCDHLKKLKFSSYLPRVFTEYGILQAANVLNTDKAILISNRIVEIFIKMHNILSMHKEIIQKVEKLERRDIEQDRKIGVIFEFLKQLKKSQESEIDFKNRRRIGFNK